MNARLERAAFNLLCGVLLPVAPAAGMGIEIAVPRGLEAMRPYVARHLLGPEGEGLADVHLQDWLPELSSRIDEFMIANGPTLERINDGRPLGSGFEAALESVRLKVEYDVQAQVEPELDQIKEVFDRLDAGRAAPDSADVQVAVTVAIALQRYRRHYLSDYQKERLDEYLPRLLGARISHGREDDIGYLSEGIEGALQRLGLSAEGGLAAVTRTVHNMSGGIAMHESLLAPPDQAQASSRFMGAAPRDLGLRPPPGRGVRAPGRLNLRQYLDAMDMRDIFLNTAAQAKGMRPEELSNRFYEESIDRGLDPPGLDDFLGLHKAKEEAMWWDLEFKEALGRELESWRAGNWAWLAAIARDEDRALERRIVASRVARFKAWRDDLIAGTAAIPTILSARFTRNDRYVHVYLGFPPHQEGRLDVGIVMTYAAPIAGDEHAWAEARALWDPVFSARALRAHEEYPKLIEMAVQMEQAGILPAGYSSQLRPLRSRWAWSALVAALAFAVAAAMAAAGWAAWTR